MRIRFLYLSLFLIVSVAVAGCAGGPMPETSETAAPAAADDGPMVTGDHITTANGDLVIEPINHATFAMGWNGETIYVDPVGGAEPFANLPGADLILVTDVHGDHMDIPTLEAVAGADTMIVAPAAVAEQLPESLSGQVHTLANGQQATLMGVTIDAVPMYNLTEDRLQFHEPGRGNGYVLTMGGTRVYISGDTEDIPEMRALENIDVAFVCFNLPYTMTEAQAADAVNEFRPAVVYPYHNGGSDEALFASLVDEGIDVRMRPWY